MVWKGQSGRLDVAEEQNQRNCTVASKLPFRFRKSLSNKQFSSATPEPYFLNRIDFLPHFLTFSIIPAYQGREIICCIKKADFRRPVGSSKRADRRVKV